MLTDFFIATVAEVQSLDINRGPSGVIQCVRAKRADPVKIVQLQCCIEGVTFDERITLLDKMLIRDGGKNGPWVFKLPDLLENRLVAAGKDELTLYGRSWSLTEEWQRDGGTPELIIPFLAEIARLAVTARNQKQCVFVWMSL